MLGAVGLGFAGILRWVSPWFLDPPLLAVLVFAVLPCSLGVLAGLALPRLRFAWAPLALPVVPMLVALLALLPPPGPQQLRMLVVGIDGAT